MWWLTFPIHPHRRTMPSWNFFKLPRKTCFRQKNFLEFNTMLFYLLLVLTAYSQAVIYEPSLFRKNWSENREFLTVFCAPHNSLNLHLHWQIQVPLARIF